MKKIFIFLCLFALTFIFSLNIGIKADETSIEFDGDVFSAGNAQYQVTNRTNYDNIDYGIKYIRDIAVSKSTTQIGGTNTLDPQVVNVLEVPSSSVLKVVNWTFSSTSSWTLQTLTKLAEDFEANNPGWVVIAGTNGDFFDINSTKALPKQTTGAAVNNGEVVRAVSSGRQVGFTNDGTANSLIGGKNLQFTDYHTLTIYDENNAVAGEFKVDKFNEAPSGNEVALYFSYYILEDDVRKTVYNTTPATNSYLIKEQERGYANSSTQMYGKGTISSANEEHKLEIGQFAIVTANQEVQSLLNDRTLVRIQQDVIGDYADCENISGCGAQLVYNGEYQEVSDGMSHYRHPRTVIGKKEDGTIVMATIDGRQQPYGMYGMTYDELSATMMYYGCTEAYNLDGGGSTTMIIRNNNGVFDVMNTPSDGGERNDANGILVVVPEMKLYVDKVTDTTLEFSYLAKCNDINISNVEITVKTDGYEETRKIEDEKYLWEGLLPNKEYSLVYSYDLTYEGNTIRNTSNPKTFSTGQPRPQLLNYSYTENDNFYIFEYHIEDPGNTISFARLKYDRKGVTLNKQATVFYLEKSKVTTPGFQIILTYNVGANPSSTEEDIYEVKLFVDTPEPEPTPTPNPNVNTGGCGSCKKSGVELVALCMSVAVVASFVLRKKH